MTFIADASSLRLSTVQQAELRDGPLVDVVHALRVARELGVHALWRLPATRSTGWLPLIEHLQPPHPDADMSDLLNTWRRRFYGSMSPILSMEERDGRTLIIDTRAIAPARRVVLVDLEQRVHAAVDVPGSLDEVRQRVGGMDVSVVLGQLVERGLVLHDDDRYVALAVRGDLPRIPPVSKNDERKRARFSEPLNLQCGRTLPSFELAYETWGTLSPQRDNAIMVCHPLTRDEHAAGKRGWWDAAIGPGRMLDTDSYFVICSNVLGGTNSTGPASIDPSTGQTYGMDFPLCTITDMVRAQKRLVEKLGIERLSAVVGGCFGGQQALEWAINFPHAVARAVVLSTTPASSAHSIAIFSVMRRLVMQDPDWQGGRYYGKSYPQTGIANALTVAVPLWMSREAMEEKFGRRGTLTHSFEAEFEVERYLADVWRRASAQIDPNSLLYVTRATEYFDLEREYGSLREAMAPIEADVLFVSYASDWRYPAAEADRMHAELLAQGKRSRHDVVDHPHGHGAFRFAVESCADAVRAFLL